MLADFRPPFFSDAALGLVLGKLCQVCLAMLHRLGIATKEPGDIRQATMSYFFRLDRRIPPSVFF